MYYVFYQDIPERSSQPGTFGHLAKQSINTPREKIKGPKCGQCEEKRAMVVSDTCWVKTQKYTIQT